MTTNLDTQAGNQPTTRSGARTLSQILPGAAGLLYAGVQIDGGITAAAYRGVSTVPDDRLNFPFSGSLATTTSTTWGVSQALFLITLLAFVRSGAVGRSRLGRTGASVAFIGGIVLVAAHAVSLTFHDARLDDPAGRSAIALFAIATLLMAAGFVVSGVAVIRVGLWTAWRRYSVLAVGIWMFCMVPLQFTSLLGPTVAVFAATIAAFSVALLAEPQGGQQ